MMMFASTRLKRPEHEIALLHRKSIVKLLARNQFKKQTPLASQVENEETSSRPSK